MVNYTKLKQEIEQEIKQKREQESIRNKDNIFNELNIEVLK